LSSLHAILASKRRTASRIQPRTSSLIPQSHDFCCISEFLVLRTQSPVSYSIGRFCISMQSHRPPSKLGDLWLDIQTQLKSSQCLHFNPTISIFCCASEFLVLLELGRSDPRFLQDQSEAVVR
jgi:hypothetical protein